MTTTSKPTRAEGSFLATWAKLSIKLLSTPKRLPASLTVFSNFLPVAPSDEEVCNSWIASNTLLAVSICFSTSWNGASAMTCAFFTAFNSVILALNSAFAVAKASCFSAATAKISASLAFAAINASWRDFLSSRTPSTNTFVSSTAFCMWASMPCNASSNIPTTRTWYSCRSLANVLHAPSTSEHSMALALDDSTSSGAARTAPAKVAQ
mmetsp:Transcript_53127/g.153311  ORF Transcript_53127/g.153311 Transcript_53127/m.153311 type:complete len:209 (-) Transcript_53127:144-770(-)